MYNILIVEDSIVVRKILNKLIGDNPYFNCVLCQDLAEAQAQLALDAERFFAAVVDLNLPDAPNGEVVEHVLNADIPTLVLTGNFDDDLRASLLNKGVLDYITKETRFAYTQVAKLLERLRLNLDTKALVVDDSATCSAIVCSMLKKFKFQVHAASDGKEALDFLYQHPDVRLVISDYHMPNMDGCALVKHLRQDKLFQDLVFIGLSSEGDGLLSARFIKSGANDFLKKPFYHEEFYWRIFHNLEAREMLETIREAANVDPLTGLYNRRYLFAHGELLFQERVVGQPFSVTMLDLDKFKSVNDTYGHQIGDQLIQQFAALLQKQFPEDLIGRYGGEEFVIISLRDEQTFSNDMELLRDRMSKRLFTDQDLTVTCSAGVCLAVDDTLSKMIEVADRNLYKAKVSGRDRIEYGV
ncbi:diguanylate cyclase [Marinomonas ostreistagni]|uniref:diguanylate cyclase n=1 Tax=Marinomonas ostreistagni TaxID=359209 RepID=UPI001950425E|nr:diguanylate cyclase [Marinomonas ostreistagni]MBM6549837.1 diguanylate cyclase [Marinomonas ostreistagni]